MAYIEERKDKEGNIKYRAMSSLWNPQSKTKGELRQLLLDIWQVYRQFFLCVIVNGNGLKRIGNLYFKVANIWKLVKSNTA